MRIYKIKFSYRVEYDDELIGLKNQSYLGIGEISLYQDQPFRKDMVKEEAYSIAKRELNRRFEGVKITKVACWGFYKMEKLDELDFVRK